METLKINWTVIGEHPITWFFLSLGTICLGMWLFSDADVENKFQSALSTLFISLGTAGIIRVRSPKQKP